MPLARISYAGNPDEDARTRLIARVTQVIAEEFAVPPAAVNVLLDRIAPEDWGVSGVPLAVAFRARAASGGNRTRPPRSVWATNGGHKLHALDFAGTTPAVLIVPGITSPAATWSFVVEALGLPNRIVVLDNRGRGRSDAPAQGYKQEDYASDILAWCRELGLARPILLGHSMGARAIAAAAPQLAGASLVVVDPPMSDATRPYPTPLSYFLDGLDAVAKGTTLEALRVGSPGWSDARLRDRVEWLPTCSRSAIIESHAHFHDESFLDKWAQTSGRTLFIRGGASNVVLASDLDVLARARPDAEFRTVEGAGHMIPWDDLSGFVDAVRPWIAHLNEELGTSA